MAIEASSVSIVSTTVDQVANPEVVPPFPPIRAHHLRYIGWAMGLGRIGKLTGSPESVAKYWADISQGWLNSSHPGFQEYAITTVGRNGETKPQFEKNLAGFLQEFLDDIPKGMRYTIVEERPDKLCQKNAECQLAGHCGKSKAQLADGRIVPLNETKDMNSFLTAAEWLGIPTKIRQGVSDYSDAQQIPVRMVTLRADQIARILRYMDMQTYFKEYFDGPDPANLL